MNRLTLFAFAIAFACAFPLTQEQVVAGELAEIESDINYLKKRIKGKREDIEALRKSIAEMEEKYSDRVEDINNMESATGELEAIYEKAIGLENAIRKQLAILAYYHEESRNVQVKEGAVFPELKTKDGRVLKEVTVTGVENREVNLSHSSGFSKIAFDDLPNEMKSSILAVPSGHNVQGLPKALFSQRPEVVLKSKPFANTRKLEADQRAKEIAMEHARADAKREADLAAYRSQKLAGHEMFLAERQERSRLREEARQQVIADNEVIDKQLVELYKQVDALQLQSEQLEMAFNQKIVKYDKIGGTLSAREEERRVSNVKEYNRAKMDLIQRIGILKQRIIQLRASKKSAR